MSTSDLYLGNSLNVVTEHKFLGVILDTKLTFIPYLKARSLQTVTVLELLSYTTWGSNRKCLMNLYKSLTGSRPGHGAIIYSAAPPSVLKMLDSVHHLGIHLETGAFCTSPIASLYVQSREWSLQLQRVYISFTYFLKVGAQSERPCYRAVNDTSSLTLFQA